MVSRIFRRPSPLSDLKAGVREFGRDVADDAREVASNFSRDRAPDRAELLRDVKNAVVTLGAETVGLAGLAGYRYGVSSYEHRVTPQLTRGSRIDDAKGYEKLAASGVKSLVDLTLEGTDDERLGTAAGLRVLRVGILDNSAPTQAQMKRVLDFVTAPENQPTYVHCQAGKGRTGVAVACYRMAVQRWPAAEAIAEARQFGLKLSDQVAFLEQFGRDLAAGTIDGYPKTIPSP